MKIMVIGSMNIDYVYHVDHFVQQGETLKVNSRDVVCSGNRRYPSRCGTFRPPDGGSHRIHETFRSFIEA